MEDLTIEGMALSSSVVETIIAIAAKEVEGVVSIGSPTGLFSAVLGKSNTQGIDIIPLDDGSLAIEMHLEAAYGSVLPEVADGVRSAVADAIATQVGARVAAIDVFIDSIRF